MPHLAENHYGKSRVRLLKVTRDGDTHHVADWTLGIYLTGDFTACFVDGDNTGLLATDTMKNTVYALARTSTALTMEDFAGELASFLLTRNPTLASARITVAESTWTRLETGSAFQQRGPELHTTSVTVTPAAAPAITSGVEGLVILKTSHSAFAGFHRDELTTLPDTHDRLFATEAAITWNYTPALPQQPAPDFAALRAQILATLLSTFAQHDSLSVQQTLYAMASAALTAEPLLTELTLTLPNRHNLPFDFSRFQPPFNHTNDNTIFIPTEEPHGLIQARVTR